MLDHKQVDAFNRVLFTDTIALRTVFVDITGDLIAGLLLSQIYYWHGYNEQGERRVTYQREGHTWLVKQRGDWWGEVRITPKQYDRAAGILKELGLVEINAWRSPFYDGARALHIRLLDRFYEAIQEQAKKAERVSEENLGVQNYPKVNLDKPKFPKGQNGNSPKVNFLSETTPETTNSEKENEFLDLFPDSAEVKIDTRTIEEKKEDLARSLLKGSMAAVEDNRSHDMHLGARLARVFCDGIGKDWSREVMPDKTWEQWTEKLVAIAREPGFSPEIMTDDMAVKVFQEILRPEGDFAWHIGHAWTSPNSPSLQEAFTSTALDMVPHKGKRVVRMGSGKSNKPVKM